jgi:hypothetical protein
MFSLFEKDWISRLEARSPQLKNHWETEETDREANIRYPAFISPETLDSQGR